MLTPNEQLTISRATGLYFELISLDHYWTREAKAGRRDDGLETIVAEIERLLGELADLWSFLLPIFQSNEEQLRSSFAARSAGDQKEIAQLVERRGGDFAAAVIGAGEGLKGRLGEEREQLRAELERVVRGKDSDGDISVETLIDVTLAVLGAAELLGSVGEAVVDAVGDFLGSIFG